MPSRSASGDRAPRRTLKKARHRVGSRHRDPSAESSGERIAVGKVLRPHGIRGELKVEVWSDIDERFEVDSELYLRVGDHVRRFRIRQVRPERGHLLIRLSGIETRESADELRQGIFEVDASQVPEPPEGFYYHFQLVGCECVDQATGSLGDVVEVVEDGGGILLRVEHEGRSLLVPFVDAFLGLVDVKAKRIEVRLPEGLVTICTSKS